MNTITILVYCLIIEAFPCLPSTTCFSLSFFPARKPQSSILSYFNHHQQCLTVGIFSIITMHVYLADVLLCFHRRPSNLAASLAWYRHGSQLDSTQQSSQVCRWASMWEYSTSINSLQLLVPSIPRSSHQERGRFMLSA
jgi:hypothetical protein